jgi:hypothetical protein
MLIAIAAVSWGSRAGDAPVALRWEFAEGCRKFPRPSDKFLSGVSLMFLSQRREGSIKTCCVTRKHMTSVEYGFEKQLSGLSLAEARERVTKALAAEGFGVLTEIDVKATLKGAVAGLVVQAEPSRAASPHRPMG